MSATISATINVTPAIFVAVATSLASAASAAPYTNTWDAAEGLFSTWNWGDSANWSVAYGGDTPAPASNVPTEDSVTYLNKTANITLQSGDDWHLGETYFLGTVWDRTLNVSISAGAKLSLDGTDVTSHIGSFEYRDASENNKTTIDVNGGELVLGQKEVRMRTWRRRGSRNDWSSRRYDAEKAACRLAGEWCPAQINPGDRGWQDAHARCRISRTVREGSVRQVG